LDVDRGVTGRAVTVDTNRAYWRSLIVDFTHDITPDDDDGDGGDDEFTHYLCSKVVLYQIATFDYSAEYE